MRAQEIQQFGQNRLMKVDANSATYKNFDGLIDTTVTEEDEVTGKSLQLGKMQSYAVGANREQVVS